MWKAEKTFFFYATKVLQIRAYIYLKKKISDLKLYKMRSIKNARIEA